MEKLRLYHISEGYVKFLHTLDKRVQYNKGEARPYVGIVLSINNNDYYVPLESPKPNHENIKGGGPVLKLDEGKLGIMGFNNMIPVKKRCLVDFDINAIEDEKYKALLQNQLMYCRKNKDIIYARAQKTYNKTVKGDNAFYRKVCCDFKKLEENCDKYKIKKYIQK